MISSTVFRRWPAAQNRIASPSATKTKPTLTVSGGYFLNPTDVALVGYTATYTLPVTAVGPTSVTAVITAAHAMLPNWLVIFIYIGALLAAFTTINGILATSPREVYALARDRVFPGWLAKTGKRVGAWYISNVSIAMTIVTRLRPL